MCHPADSLEAAALGENNGLNMKERLEEHDKKRLLG